MDQSLQEGGGPPNASTYCRTTLAQKTSVGIPHSSSQTHT